MNEPGIYIRHCQESNLQPVPSQAGVDYGWSARSLYWLKYMLQKEDKFASGPACCCLFVMWSIWLQNHKKVKMYIISIARRAVKELSETNIILQDCYYGHLAHFQYTSFWKLKKIFSLHSKTHTQHMNRMRVVYSPFNLHPTGEYIIYTYPTYEPYEGGVFPLQPSSYQLGSEI